MRGCDGGLTHYTPRAQHSMLLQMTQDDVDRHDRRVRKWSRLFGKEFRHFILHLHNPLVATTGVINFINSRGHVTEIRFTSKVTYTVNDQTFTSIKAATAHLKSLM